MTSESESANEEDRCWCWLLELSENTEVEDVQSSANNNELSSKQVDSSKLSDGVETLFRCWNFSLGSAAVPTSLFNIWSELCRWIPSAVDGDVVDSFLLVRGDVGVLLVLVTLWLNGVVGRDSRFSSIITPSDSSASRKAFFKKPEIV